MGNGTGPLRSVAGDQRDGGGAEDADRIDAVVIIEAAVFGGDECVHHHRRNLIQLQRNAALLAVLGDQFAIGAVNLHRYLQPHVFQRCDVGQLRLDIFVQAENRGCSQHDATYCKD